MVDNKIDGRGERFIISSRQIWIERMRRFLHTGRDRNLIALGMHWALLPVEPIHVAKTDLPDKAERRRREVLVAVGAGCFFRLEVRLQRELIFTRRVIWICLRHSAESGVSEACRATAVSNVEVWRVGDIKGLRSELHFYTFGNGKVLKDG